MVKAKLNNFVPTEICDVCKKRSEELSKEFLMQREPLAAVDGLVWLDPQPTLCGYGRLAGHGGAAVQDLLCLGPVGHPGSDQHRAAIFGASRPRALRAPAGVATGREAAFGAVPTAGAG